MGRKRAWGGSDWEAGAEGSMGRNLKGLWAEASLGRKGGWGGREYGAEGSLGRKRGWGGSEAGAEASLGR